MLPEQQKEKLSRNLEHLERKNVVVVVVFVLPSFPSFALKIIIPVEEKGKIAKKKGFTAVKVTLEKNFPFVINSWKNYYCPFGRRIIKVFCGGPMAENVHTLLTQQPKVEYSFFAAVMIITPTRLLNCIITEYGILLLSVTREARKQ